MAPDRSEPEEQETSSVWRRRVAAADVDQWPAPADIGVGLLGQRGVDWQTLRMSARWTEMIVVHEDPDRSAWVPEIVGLFGIGGELAIVCAEAAMDVWLLDREAETAESEPARAAAWRSVRFFTEAQVNYLVIFGHNVANLVVRTLALYNAFVPDPLGRRFTRAFGQRVADRDAWLSLNGRTVAELRTAAEPLGPAATALCELVAELVGGAVGELIAVRGVQYHRWRGESPGLPGVSFNTPRVLERLLAGEGVGIGGKADPYDEGHEILDELREKVVAALVLLDSWMPRFEEAWRATFEEVRAGNEPSAVRLGSPGRRARATEDS